MKFLQFLRAILFNIIFWLAFFLWLIISMPFACFMNKKLADKLIFKNISKLTLFCLKFFVNINVEIKNKEKILEALQFSPVIIGCNHQSMFETLIFPMIINDLSIVAKTELFTYPIIGFYMKKFGCISVNRAKPISAIKSLIRNAKQSIENNLSVLIFPNGTRINTTIENNFKIGIYTIYNNCKVPVIPCSTNSGSHWKSKSFLKQPGTITLQFHAPILSGLNSQEFMCAFESSMQD